MINKMKNLFSFKNHQIFQKEDSARKSSFFIFKYFLSNYHNIVMPLLFV